MLRRVFQIGLMCGLFLLGFSTYSYGQTLAERSGARVRSSTTTTVEGEALRAIKNADAVRLAKGFNGNVELSLPTKSGNFSKDQAKMVMSEFFNAYQVEDFSLEYVRETANKTDRYLVGEYLSTKGTFDVKITSTLQNGMWYIDSIQVIKR